MRSLLTPKEKKRALARIAALISQPLRPCPSFAPFVSRLLTKRTTLLSFAQKHQTPFYLLDKKELDNSIAVFSRALRKYLPRSRVFYAVKTNHHPEILKSVFLADFGFDVSSVREMNLCKQYPETPLVFSGPGKTYDTLKRMVHTNRNITILIDNFCELKRLGAIRPHGKNRIRAGVRISTEAHDGWKKFGIPLSELAVFWREAKKYQHIALSGIQFHHSHNSSAQPYTDTLRSLGSTVKKYFSPRECGEILFIDCGGGFLPYKSEGVYTDATPQGIVIQEAYTAYGARAPFRFSAVSVDSPSLGCYMQNIASAIKTHLEPLVSCEYYFEPGRIISNNAMHILLRVVDVKSHDCVILNGGSNIIGWERLTYDYFPVINLTHPSLKEHPVHLYGSLCLSSEFDSWGRSYYGSTLEEGDVLMVPFQGCLTYSLAQNFIHPIPPVYIMK